MAGSNNTTQLGMGGTLGTRKFKDSTASNISSSISRDVYRNSIKSDKRLQELRKAVYRLVQTWSREDKILILTEYGDTAQLRGSADDDTLNKVLTESLIIHLEPADLNQLYNDVIVKQSALKKDIKRINEKKVVAAKKMKRQLTTSNFEVNFNIVQNIKVKSIHKYEKMRKKMNKGFKVPRYVVTKYKSLRKEVFEVLKNVYNTYELAGVAYTMGIEFEDNTKPKDLMTMITNKVCLFVDLVMGKSKVVGAAILDPEPYNNILQYTSFSYITGKPGMDQGAWIQLRKNAEAAKKFKSNMMRSGKNRFARRTRLPGVKLVTKAKDSIKTSKTYNALKDFRRRMSDAGIDSTDINSIPDKYKAEAQYFLIDKTPRELYNLAAQYNIDTKKIGDLDKLRSQIIVQSKSKKHVDKTTGLIIGADNARERAEAKLKKKLAKYDGNTKKSIFGARKRNKLESKLAVLGASPYDVEKPDGQQVYWEEPLPVYIVERNGSDSTKTAVDPKTGLYTDGNILFTKSVDEVLAAMAKTGHEPKSKAIINKKAQVGKKYKLNNADLDWANENNFKFATGAYSFIAGDSLTERANPELVTMRGDGSFSVKPLKAGPENGNSPFAIRKYATGGEGTAGSVLKLDNKYLTNAAADMNIEMLTGKMVQPVFVVNKSLNEGQGVISSAITGVSKTISNKFGELFIGLGTPAVLGAPMGVGALSMPMFTVLGVKNTIENILSDSLDQASEVFKFASGGTITGGNKIITGDAAGSNIFAKGAKPELVTSSGDMTITPLNKTGTESRSKVSRMSTTERRSALATAISSHAVKYDYKLPAGVTEITNAGEALKVFSVKPGIIDPITVAGEETTLANMIANMVVQLNGMAETIAAGNLLLSQIASKPVASISGGSNGNPFTGSAFPSSIDNILGGE